MTKKPENPDFRGTLFRFSRFGGSGAENRRFSSFFRVFWGPEPEFRVFWGLGPDFDDFRQISCFLASEGRISCFLGPEGVWGGSVVLVFCPNYSTGLLTPSMDFALRN